LTSDKQKLVKNSDEKLRGNKVSCVVLAAGLSSRFGTAKQLATLRDGTSLIQNAVNIANQSKAAYVFVVLGNKSAEIMEGLDPGRAQVLLNKDYETGLSSSIRTAISNLPNDCSAVVLMVADQPFLGSEHVDLLIESLQTKPRSKIAALAFQNEPRNPVIFSREVFALLETLTGDKGAKDLLKKRPQDVTLINIKDPLVFQDINTKSQLRITPRILEKGS
jgi:molybdenum cofactor cytidylyltransferase